MERKQNRNGALKEGSRLKAVGEKAAAACGLFVFLAAVLMGVLVLSSKLPKEAMRPHMVQSAELLCEKDMFFEVAEGVYASKVDRYADSILLSIAWQFDGTHPVQSVMRAAYYYSSVQEENENLRESLQKNLPPNQQYLRYWHGSAVFVRLFHLIGSIRGMYVFHAALLALLIGCLLHQLIKNRLYAGAFGVVAAFAAVSVWFVPFCLEYSWMFLWMLVLSLLAVRLALEGRDGWLGNLFLAGGMVANYLDFLTTETLTLTVPLLLVLYIQSKKGVAGGKPGWHTAVCTLHWGVGYVGMWLAKWLAASVVLGENVMPYVTGHIDERLGGTKDLLRQLWLAVCSNVSLLCPFCYGIAGALAGGCLLVGLLYVFFVYWKKTQQRTYAIWYALIGMVPFVRFLALHNHSAIHCFFTYRALAASVLALCFVLLEWIDGEKLRQSVARIVHRGV